MEPASAPRRDGGTTSPSGSGRPQSRAATEAALEDAAVDLLRRDGVLAGLNLREVADHAGVNRGLVYHYYGSRAKLLQRAIKRHGQANLDRLRGLYGLVGAHRWRRFFEVVLADPEPVELTTLLLLDGTAEMRTMPLREATQAAIDADVAAGALDPEVDRVALHAVMTTAVYGYLLYRRSFAAELGIAVDELDERVAHLLYGRLYDGLRPPAAEGHPVSRDATVVRGTDPEAPASTDLDPADRTDLAPVDRTDLAPVDRTDLAPTNLTPAAWTGPDPAAWTDPHAAGLTDLDQTKEPSDG